MNCKISNYCCHKVFLRIFLNGKLIFFIWMSEEYESVCLVKPEVFVYRIPPIANNRGYRFLFFLLFVIEEGHYKIISLKYQANFVWIFFNNMVHFLLYLFLFILGSNRGKLERKRILIDDLCTLKICVKKFSHAFKLSQRKRRAERELEGSENSRRLKE